MRPFIGSLIVAGLLLLGTVSAQTSSEQDEQKIRSVVAEYMAARNKNSPEAVRKLFTPDADQLVSAGEERKGLADLVRGTSISSRKEAGQNSITIEAVRLIDNDVAIVDGRYRNVGVNGAIRDMWTTLVLKRVGSDWRIAGIRNMLPAPAH
jgi:uncharacterized protein (TIGR02246 family)